MCSIQGVGVGVVLLESKATSTSEYKEMSGRKYQNSASQLVAKSGANAEPNC